MTQDNNPINFPDRQTPQTNTPTLPNQALANPKTGAFDAIATNLTDVLSWARSSALWPLGFGLACCAIEMMSTYASHYDLDRFGIIPRTSPRQADLLIVSGTVTFKMADRVRRLWQQMPEPKYVLSMGSCANCGGPYWKHGYHVLKGVDRVIPVDVYVPGCPPRPEALIGGLLQLQQKIKQDAKPQPPKAVNSFFNNTNTKS